MTLQGISKESVLDRLNLRVIAFVAVICGFIAYPLYQGMKVALTGGIVDHGSYVEVDLKSMSNFEMDQNIGTMNDIPDQYRALDGKKVQLDGEMWSPNGSGDHVDNFVLVYSITKCCIGPSIKVQHLVISTVPNNKDVRYYTGQVRVVGTLHVKVVREEGKVQSVYKLDVDSLESK